MDPNKKRKYTLQEIEVEGFNDSGSDSEKHSLLYSEPEVSQRKDAIIFCVVFPVMRMWASLTSSYGANRPAARVMTQLVPF